MAWGVSCVDTTLNKSFYKLGKIIGRNPGYFVIIPVLLTLLCITGWVILFTKTNIFLRWSTSVFHLKIYEEQWAESEHHDKCLKRFWSFCAFGNRVDGRTAQCSDFATSSSYGAGLFIESTCSWPISHKGRQCHEEIQTKINSTSLHFHRYQQLKYEIDPEYLFSPVKGEGKMERAIVETHFKVNYTSRFSVGRITRPGKCECALFSFFLRAMMIHGVTVTTDHTSFCVRSRWRSPPIRFYTFFLLFWLWFCAWSFWQLIFPMKYTQRIFLFGLPTISIVYFAYLLFFGMQFQLLVQQVKAVSNVSSLNTELVMQFGTRGTEKREMKRENK